MFQNSASEKKNVFGMLRLKKTNKDVDFPFCLLCGKARGEKISLVIGCSQKYTLKYKFIYKACSIALGYLMSLSVTFRVTEGHF